MAVVEGKHPNGESFSSDMPRWNISDSDLEDLAEFMKSESLKLESWWKNGPRNEYTMSIASGGIGVLLQGDELGSLHPPKDLLLFAPALALDEKLEP
jgi:hypothetical protein